MRPYLSLSDKAH